MKKISVIVLCLVICVSLCAGCKGNTKHLEEIHANYPQFGIEDFVEKQTYDKYHGEKNFSCPYFATFEEYATFLFHSDYREDIDLDITDRAIWCPYVDNDVSIDDIYDGQVISNDLAWALNGVNQGTDLIWVYRRFEPELYFVRETSEGIRYAVFNAEGGGRFFLFLASRPYVLMDGTENEYYRVFGLYVAKPMSYSDFAGIKIGDSIDKVIEVDQTAEFMKKHKDVLTRRNTIHLLSDGVIVFKYADSDGSLVVDDILYSKDYRVDFSKFTDGSSQAPTEWNVKVLAGDYPQG